MEVGDAGGTVDIVRPAGGRRDTTVNGLTNLTDDNKIINISNTQRSENIFPGRGKRSDPCPK